MYSLNLRTSCCEHSPNYLAADFKAQENVAHLEYGTVHEGGFTQESWNPDQPRRRIMWARVEKSTSDFFMHFFTLCAREMGVTTGCLDHD